MYIIGKRSLNSGILTSKNLQKRNCNISLKEALSSFNSNLPALISSTKDKLDENKAKMEEIEKGQIEHREMVEKQMKKVRELLEYNQKLIEESLEYFHSRLKEFERLAYPEKKGPTHPMEKKNETLTNKYLFNTTCIFNPCVGNVLRIKEIARILSGGSGTHQLMLALQRFFFSLELLIFIFR
jgi:hypothetical protein